MTRALVAVLLLAAASVRADEIDPDTEVAKRYFRAGSELYNAAKYEEAIKQFELAKQAKPLPDFEYNIGRAYDRLGRWQEALAYYERYVATAKNPEPEVRDRIVALRQRTANPNPNPNPTANPNPNGAPTVTSSAPPARRFHVAIPAVLAGVAVVGLAAGGGLYGSVDSDYQSLKKTCAPSCDSGRVDSMRGREAASFAMLAIGGTALVVDVVLWTFWAKRR